MTLPNGWEMVVGLEVHTELRTTTKMFCGCANAFGAAPNTHVCPVCLGLPGSLPCSTCAPSTSRWRSASRCTRTIGSSTFHRKNYFYPDMPKDFQISQYDLPINSGGYLDLPDGSQVTIERAHLEEDTGKTTHLGASGRIHGADRSLVDYNRSGVPLVEIVSGPDIRRRPGPPLRVGAARHPHRDGRVGRAHGRRLDAHRRQRLGAKERRALWHAL